MAKRPTGFGKASKSKKPRTEKEEEPEPEVQIELANDGEDEELNEIYGLYAKLITERDPKLARGLIHECNSMLKTRDEQNIELPPKFHVVYASGLLTLADPDFEEKEHENFKQAGLERMEVGLATADQVSKSIAAQELIRLQHINHEKELATKALNLLKLSDSEKKPELSLERARAAFYLVNLADEIEDQELAKTAFDLLSTHLELDSRDEEGLRWTNKGLGHYYLNQVALNEDEEDPEIKELVKKAVPHLEKSITDADPDSHVGLAEALLMLDQNDKALRHLKKAQILGVENLHELIESLEE